MCITDLICTHILKREAHISYSLRANSSRAKRDLDRQKGHRNRVCIIDLICTHILKREAHISYSLRASSSRAKRDLDRQKGHRNRVCIIDLICTHTEKGGTHFLIIESQQLTCQAGSGQTKGASESRVHH